MAAATASMTRTDSANHAGIPLSPSHPGEGQCAGRTSAGAPLRAGTPAPGPPRPSVARPGAGPPCWPPPVPQGRPVCLAGIPSGGFQLGRSTRSGI